MLVGFGNQLGAKVAIRFIFTKLRLFVYLIDHYK